MPRSTLKQYAVTGAGALALGLALSGCAGDSAAPAPLDSPSAKTATADPTPSEDSSQGGSGTTTGPPTLPPEARGTTRASAGPFVRYWVDNYRFAVTHLAPDRIRRRSLPGCEACSIIADSLTRIKDDGGHFKGTGWRVRRVEVLPEAI